MTSLPGDRLQPFREHGFFIVPAFLDAASMRPLRRACDVALDAARAGSTTTGHTTPEIGLFVEPAYFAGDRRALERIAAFAGSAQVCALLAGLERPGEGRMPRVKNTDYYHEQTKRDWDGDWHRDSQLGQADPELERARILTTTSVHVRIALEDDDRLELVPGSHDRWDTPEELRIRKGTNRTARDMPGATRIVLRAGDACVFHAWSVHRATYRCRPLRRTLDSLYAYGPVPA